ncbi:hypothetical protein AB5J72_01570 [Streptomyces sp. CG1]|uniref:hypothetical protein n=1 Tax=Streptomyces sp. CG1 TaxID=1287523 RepID=UPI0034E22670
MADGTVHRCRQPRAQSVPSCRPEGPFGDERGAHQTLPLLVVRLPAPVGLSIGPLVVTPVVTPLSGLAPAHGAPDRIS